MCACFDVCIYMYVYMYACIYVRMRVCMNQWMDIWIYVYVCRHECMYVCMYVCLLRITYLQVITIFTPLLISICYLYPLATLYSSLITACHTNRDRLINNAPHTSTRYLIHVSEHVDH